MSHMAAKARVSDTSIEVVPATADDLVLVISILAQAGEWLLSKGIHQWLQPPPATLMLKAIERGEVHIAKVEGTPCGTFTLNWSDALWEGRCGEAGYLHRLAIRRVFGGRGLGLHLLRRAERLAACAGKEFLRLDCWAGNQVLCDYYERAGFSRRGTAAESDYTCCLFEKDVVSS